MNTRFSYYILGLSRDEVGDSYQRRRIFYNDYLDRYPSSAIQALFQFDQNPALRAFRNYIKKHAHLFYFAKDNPHIVTLFAKLKKIAADLIADLSQHTDWAQGLNEQEKQMWIQDFAQGYTNRFLSVALQDLLARRKISKAVEWLYGRLMHVLYRDVPQPHESFLLLQIIFSTESNYEIPNNYAMAFILSHPPLFSTYLLLEKYSTQLLAQHPILKEVNSLLMFILGQLNWVLLQEFTLLQESREKVVDADQLTMVRNKIHYTLLALEKTKVLLQSYKRYMRKDELNTKRMQEEQEILDKQLQEIKKEREAKEMQASVIPEFTNLPDLSSLLLTAIRQHQLTVQATAMTVEKGSEQLESKSHSAEHLEASGQRITKRTNSAHVLARKNIKDVVYTGVLAEQPIAQPTVLPSWQHQQFSPPEREALQVTFRTSRAALLAVSAAAEKQNVPLSKKSHSDPHMEQEAHNAQLSKVRSSSMPSPTLLYSPRPSPKKSSSYIEQRTPSGADCVEMCAEEAKPAVGSSSVAIDLSQVTLAVSSSFSPRSSSSSTPPSSASPRNPASPPGSPRSHSSPRGFHLGIFSRNRALSRDEQSIENKAIENIPPPPMTDRKRLSGRFKAFLPKISTQATASSTGKRGFEPK